MPVKLENALVILSVIAAGSLMATGCTKNKCVENPKEDCVCTMQYDPVCGCNHKTYSNACVAECAGITRYKKGPCEPVKDSL